MSDRFGFELTELDSKGLSSFLQRRQQNRLPARQAYIASLERLRSWPGLKELRELPPQFDLIVVDEAHSMRNQNTKSFALGTELADWAESLVFLSATPINLGQQDLLSLLELLAPEDYGDLWDLELRLEPNQYINRAIAALNDRNSSADDVRANLEGLKDTLYGNVLRRRPEFQELQKALRTQELSMRERVDAKRKLAELNTLSAVITRTKKVEVDDRKALRKENRHEIHWTPHELAFYREYVKWCDDRAKDTGSNLYFAMQMPLRLASACLPMAREAVLNPDSFGSITDADTGKEADQLAPHRELVAAAIALEDGTDTKFDELLVTLESLQRRERQAILFTFSRPTLRYLYERLSGTFSIAVMHGGVSRDQRKRIMADFRAGKYEFVFANRVASEGLDFEFCSAVINYDLPWNPMEIEQRIGRIDRIGQKEESISVVNFINEDTIDERILDRLLTRIAIFESSIGALEPIIAASAPMVLQAGLDFSLTADEREQKVHDALMALEEQRAGVKEVSDASSSLLVIDDVDVAGLEDDLLRTGRYIGQRELARLIDDWARVDGTAGVDFTEDGLTARIYGNEAMARRVNALVAKSVRTRAEVEPVVSQLRNEMVITITLDQERARTSGGMLLTAGHPLVMAAASVPEHRQARFASIRVVSRSDSSKTGHFVVILARAIGASRAGDEIWGAAVDPKGRNGGDDATDALLAALADGTLLDAPLPSIERLPVLARRAADLLQFRHDTEQTRRDVDFEARQEARRTSLTEQYRRRLQSIDRRITTARQNQRGANTIALFAAQRRRAEQRFKRVIEDLESTPPPTIRIEPIAACVVEVCKTGFDHG